VSRRGAPPVARRGAEHPQWRGSIVHRRRLVFGRRMKRGEIWTVGAGKEYLTKPRPAVILQDDRFDATESITVCVLTTDPPDAPLFRLLVTPDERNGLRAPSRLMVDKITTVPKSKL